MTATITFYGGAGTVTGANFLLDTHSTGSGQAGSPQTGKRILIDCGALQRERLHDDENSRAFAYDPTSIDVLLVTHAHADHIGRIPKLVRDGFRGTIYSTAATRDLAALMFDDALRVMHDEVMKRGGTMMYEKGDADRALKQWQTHDYHAAFHLGDVRVEFLDAGHILGSAMIRLVRNDRVVLFSGDLGNSPEPLLNDTESPEGAHYIVMESVYGDRVHEGRDERKDALRAAVEDARSRGGVLLIPSFSIERTQILLYELDSMIESGALSPIPVYLDAPLAIRVTDVFRTYASLLNPDVQERFDNGGDPFSFPGLKLTAAVGQSREIHDAPNPKVIIAGAGMSSGGRIREHEKHYLGDKNVAVLFVGYQAPGSLGRRIADGEKMVEIDGERIRVRARVDTLSGYSGHKDRDGLLEFVDLARESVQHVFVAMGEPKSEMFLAQRIRDFLNISASVPKQNETVPIDF